MFIIIVFLLGSDRQSGCLLFFVPAVLLSILTPLLLPSYCSVSSPYLILAVPMHARVFWKTLLHEFLIAYGHILIRTFFFDNATTSAQCVLGAKN